MIIPYTSICPVLSICNCCLLISVYALIRTFIRALESRKAMLYVYFVDEGFNRNSHLLGVSSIFLRTEFVANILHRFETRTLVCSSIASIRFREHYIYLKVYRRNLRNQNYIHVPGT
jgi:hypothetical protein